MGRRCSSLSEQDQSLERSGDWVFNPLTSPPNYGYILCCECTCVIFKTGHFWKWAHWPKRQESNLLIHTSHVHIHVTSMLAVCESLPFTARSKLHIFHNRTGQKRTSWNWGSKLPSFNISRLKMWEKMYLCNFHTSKFVFVGDGFRQLLHFIVISHEITKYDTKTCISDLCCPEIEIWICRKKSF